MIDYFSKEYNDSGRWVSYWYQIREVLELNPKNILIVGKGDGLVPLYLKMRGLNIVTLDSDQSLNPDIKASVLNMPLDGDSFDVVLCAEVLEHLPYDEFSKALSEIKRVAKFGAILSLPHFGPAIRFLLKLPLLSEVKFLWKLPYPRQHVFKGEHYWEIGRQGYSLGKIREEIKKSGFLLTKDYVIFENPLHHFFILKK